MALNPSIPPGGVRGGKEEIRASLLKPYLLRLRKERGERHASSVLLGAGIDPQSLDAESAWLSASRARRALRVFAQELGERALEHRERWALHPETLGTHMRMLRAAKGPEDAYRFLVANASEWTRVGTWEECEIEKGARDRMKLSYRLREEENDEEGRRGERLLCAARRGELASYPMFWGFPEATIVHSACIADDAPACVYEVKWKSPRDGSAMVAAAFGSAALCGGTLGIAAGLSASALAVVLGAALGGGGGWLWERNRRLAHARVYESHRIASLERALQLRGEGEARAQAPGELTGTVLGGKYRIGRKIGSGGIGVVYAAEHTSLGHEVAIKVLRGAAAMDGSEIARLRREAHIQVRLDQANIARVMDLDQMADGSIYVVMERLHGRSLADKMSKEGPVAPGFAIPCFIDVCRALAAAHGIGVVHRDLKPGNIFLCDEGVSKVLDFGMSKLTSAESLTQAGYTLGTPEYMAPEQCIGANVEARTDLYAFGVVMYEALTGELPINSPNRRELLDLHQRQVPKPMRARRPDLPIPAELDVAVMTCLRKKTHERPRDANELESMLAAIDTSELTTSYTQTSSRPRSVAQ
ncbi:MAG TPA: serine/threonine-protein kinase [Polyangiaceae bacterium]|jgi:serine/threonine-protein kinase|nr:serine/threonine-protein kinase [Polyangiaceae bacterium]